MRPRLLTVLRVDRAPQLIVTMRGPLRPDNLSVRLSRFSLTHTGIAFAAGVQRQQRTTEAGNRALAAVLSGDKTTAEAEADRRAAADDNAHSEATSERHYNLQRRTQVALTGRKQPIEGDDELDEYLSGAKRSVSSHVSAPKVARTT